MLTSPLGRNRVILPSAGRTKTPYGENLLFFFFFPIFKISKEGLRNLFVNSDSNSHSHSHKICEEQAGSISADS